MAVKNIQGDVNLIGGALLQDGKPFSVIQYDGIRFTFNENAHYDLDIESNFASYVRVNGQVMIFVASFYITKDTIGTGSSPIIIGSFKSIPNEVWDNIVAGSSGYVDEQDIKAFVDGGFTCVGSKVALVKNTNDHTLDLILETTNMENDVEYHIRYESVLLTSNNIADIPKVEILNLGSQEPLDVTFSEGLNFPTGSDLYEEVTINGNVFIKFPTFYKKSFYNGNELVGYAISKIKPNNDWIPYDCFLDEQGNVLPYVLIGKYCMTSEQSATSQSGTSVEMTSAVARPNARALGTGYQLFDCAMYCFLRDLAFAVKKAFTNIDGFFGIQDLDKTAYVDGVSCAGGVIAYSNKPSAYIDFPVVSTTGYSQLAYAVTKTALKQCVAKVGYDSSHPTISLVFASSNARDFTKYYCAEAYLSTASGTRTLQVKMIGDLFNTNMSMSDTKKRQRLCYRPVNQ